MATVASVAIGAGNAVLVAVSSVLEPATVTWNGNALTVKSSTGGMCSIWELDNASAGTGDVVATCTDTGGAQALSIEVSEGLSLVASPFDVEAHTTGSSTTPSSGNTATTAQAEEVCFGAIATGGPSSDTAGSWSNGWTGDERAGTTGGTAASNRTISSGHLVVHSTGAQVAAKTGITSRAWGACCITLKASSVTNVTVGVPLASAGFTAPGVTFAIGATAIAVLLATCVLGVPDITVSQVSSRTVPLATFHSDAPGPSYGGDFATVPLASCQISAAAAPDVDVIVEAYTGPSESTSLSLVPLHVTNIPPTIAYEHNDFGGGSGTDVFAGDAIEPGADDGNSIASVKVFVTGGHLKPLAGYPQPLDRLRWKVKIGTDTAAQTVEGDPFATTGPYPWLPDYIPSSTVSSPPFMTQPNGAPWSWAAVNMIKPTLETDWTYGPETYTHTYIEAMWVEVYGVVDSGDPIVIAIFEFDFGNTLEQPIAFETVDRLKLNMAGPERLTITFDSGGP